MFGDTIHSSAPSIADADLEAAGNDAWESRRFEEAAQIYRQLAVRDPDSTAAAFRLASSLAEIDRLAEADQIFAQATRHNPNDFWMGYHWAIKFHAAGYLDRAELIARRLIERFPGQPGPYWLVGDVAMKQYEFAVAERYFNEAFRRSSTDAKVAELLASARLYQRVTASWEPPRLWPRQDLSTPDYEIFFINMETSTRRREKLEDNYVDSPVPVRRVPGVIGSQLPLAVAQTLVRQPGQAVKRGTLGCTLSHIAAWELMLRDGLRHCMIIEDDAMPLVRPPARIEQMNIPDGFDVCFVQISTQPILAPEQREEISMFTAVSLCDAWKAFPPDFNAPRTTGYVISETGAKRLLEYFERDGLAGDVDWRMVAYSVGSAQELPDDSVAARVVAGLHRRTQAFEPLSTYFLYPAVLKEHAVDYPRLEMDRDDKMTHLGNRRKDGLGIR